MSGSSSNDPASDPDADAIDIDHAPGVQVGDHNNQYDRPTLIDAGRDAIVAGRDINVENLHVQVASLPDNAHELKNSKLPVALDQGPYLQEKRQGFIGREWLFSLVSNWVSTGQESALWIAGDPGIGKSAFIAELAQRNPGGCVVACHFCTREDRFTLEPGTFVSSLSSMLASHLPAFASALRDQEVRAALKIASSYPGQALDRGIISPLSRLPSPAGGPRMILVDGLDEAISASVEGGVFGDETIASLLISRLGRLPSWIRVIITARQDRRFSEELAGLPISVIDGRSSENLGDLDRFVASQMGVDRKIPDEGDRVSAIVNASDGNFLYAKSVLREIRLGQLSIESPGSLPNGISGFYSRQFRRLLPSPTDMAARPVLEVLVAALAPLTVSGITSAAGLDQYKTEDILGRLSEFIRNRDGRVALFHRSLADWLTRPQSSFYIDTLRGHERLAADYVTALDIPFQPQTPSADSSITDYRGRYGLDHLTLIDGSVSSKWNPWVFATVALVTFTHLSWTNWEDEIPGFARQYMASAIAARKPSRIAELALLTCYAAEARYHDSGLLRIDVEKDGAWSAEITYNINNGRALSDAITLSAWGAVIAKAGAVEFPDHKQEFRRPFGMVRMLGELTSNLYYAGWVRSAGLSEYFEDFGQAIGQGLSSVAHQFR